MDFSIGIFSQFFYQKNIKKEKEKKKYQLTAFTSPNIYKIFLSILQIRIYLLKL